MFPDRYYPNRYFSPRYFPSFGAVYVEDLGPIYIPDNYYPTSNISFGGPATNQFSISGDATTSTSLSL